MPHLFLVRNRCSEVEVKMEKTLSCECYNPRIVIQGEGKETTTRYFPESTVLAKASKVNIQNAFPTFLEISGLGVRKDSRGSLLVGKSFVVLLQMQFCKMLSRH